MATPFDSIVSQPEFGSVESLTAPNPAGFVLPPAAQPPAESGPELIGGLDLGRAADAISRIESGGNYQAVGPATDRGDRALGRYQVMASNLPAWLAEAGLPQMSAGDFLNSPAAQDQLFRFKFGQYAQRYGNRAASAWFAGERGMSDPSRQDQLGTNVARYQASFDSFYGGQGGQPMALGGPQGGARTAPAGGLPMAATPMAGPFGDLWRDPNRAQNLTALASAMAQQPVAQQRFGAGLMQAAARIQAEHHGALPAQQLAQLLVRSPEFGATAIGAGPNGPGTLNAIANMFGKAPMGQITAAPGASVIPQDPTTGAINPAGAFTAPLPPSRELRNVGPNDIVVDAQGRLVAQGQPVDPNRQPMANQRAETLAKIAADLQPAQAELGNLQMLQRELAQFSQSNPSGLWPWQSFLSRYGINLQLTGDAQTDNLNAINALIDRLTPAQRQGLPGAASDRDVSMFRGSLGSLTNSAEGNQRILNNLIGLAQRRVETAHIANLAQAEQITPTAAMGLLGAPRDQVQLDHFAEEFPDMRVGNQGPNGTGRGIRNIFQMNSQELLEMAQKLTDVYQGRGEKMPAPLERMIRHRWRVIKALEGGE